MKYVFDLDGTLCTLTDGQYEKAKPILDRIEHVNELYDQGHDIIIWTARGMSKATYDSSFELDPNVRDLVINQLIQWGVKYHHVIVGKPSGDIYIDDKGMNANGFFRT